MKILVVYFSMNGHTRKAAGMIASELTGAEITMAELAYRGKYIAFAQDMENIKGGDLSHFDFDRAVLDLAQYDKVFIGMPTYGGAPATAFDGFLKNCKNAKGREWVVFATCATTGKNVLGLMKDEVEKAGGRVTGQALFKSLFGVGRKKARTFAQAFSN